MPYDMCMMSSGNLTAISCLLTPSGFCHAWYLAPTHGSRSCGRYRAATGVALLLLQGGRSSCRRCAAGIGGQEGGQGCRRRGRAESICDADGS